MKALTLHQPFASLIMDGRKTIETRPRAWHYQGWFAIHAGLHVDADACRRFGYDPETIPRGVVLGVVEKTGCVQFPSPLAPPDPYGDFGPGRYGYLLQRPTPLVSPVSARGLQGFWDWNPTNLNEILRPKSPVHITVTNGALPNASPPSWLDNPSSAFTVTAGTLDLSGHAENCELRRMPMTLCSAMAMDPNRKVLFMCTCGAR